MRFSVAVLLVALISGSLASAMGQAKLAIPADHALEKQIRDSIEQARSDGNLSRVQRELSKLLELYPNEPLVRARIYLAMAEASTGLGDDDKSRQDRAMALAIDPHAAEWNGNQEAVGESRGQKADKILGFLSTGLQIATQIAQSRQQGAPNAPQIVGQQMQQMNSFPQAPVGMPGAPPSQMQQGAPGGFSASQGMVVVGYDANNQPIYAPAQQGAQAQPMQPAQGMFPAQPGGTAVAGQQMGQMQQQQPAFNPANQSVYPAAPQGQTQGYPQQPYQQQPYQPQQQAAYPSQQPYQQQPYQQQQPAYQQAQPAYSQQQPYQQPQSAYSAQQPYAQQQTYPSQQAYPASPGSPMQQLPYAGSQAMQAPSNPYAVPANYGRRNARGGQAPPMKVYYDRSHAGDSAYFSDPCAALLAVDAEGALTVTPGCGEAPMLIPASDIVELRMNVAMGRKIGAFHIESSKGLYLICTSDSGTTDDSLEILRSLRQELKMTD